MSNNAVRYTKIAQANSSTSNQLHEQRNEGREYQQKSAQAILPVSRGSIAANILSTLLLRIASRSSFILLGFYLGGRFTSAAVVALVLESFYVSELLLAPIVGSFSDRMGRKPFLLSAPVLGSGAVLCLVTAAFLFPQPNAALFDVRLATLLLMVLVGRLLEGAATALNTPACLGYISDTTIGQEKLRVRVMTAFEVATVGGLALAIPFGGKISSLLGIWGFFVVIALHLVNFVIVACFLKESLHYEARAEALKAYSSRTGSLKVLRNPHILTFLPAWLSVNALVGAWITLITIILVYPNPAADARFPGQLLYGGFSQTSATLLVGGFGLLFLAGMGLWMLILPHLRRATVMFVGLGGLSLSIVVLTIINSLGENPTSLPGSAKPQLLVLLSLLSGGVILLSGFTPASLTQMAAIAEMLPGKRGAVMGLYSLVLGVGQLVGATVGGLAVDWGGFYGLMGFSLVLGLVSLSSVLYMRIHGHDLVNCSPKSVTPNMEAN